MQSTVEHLIKCQAQLTSLSLLKSITHRTFVVEANFMPINFTLPLPTCTIADPTKNVEPFRRIRRY